MKGFTFEVILLFRASWRNSWLPLVESRIGPRANYLVSRTVRMGVRDRRVSACFGDFDDGGSDRVLIDVAILRDQGAD